MLLFMAVIAAISGWWLSQQRLTAKPWLEQGALGEFPGTGASLLPAAKIGLGVFLANSLSKSHGAEVSSYLGYFMVVNMLVAALWFLLLSVLLKRWSTYARTTPFVGPF